MRGRDCQRERQRIHTGTEVACGDGDELARRTGMRMATRLRSEGRVILNPESKAKQNLWRHEYYDATDLSPFIQQLGNGHHLGPSVRRYRDAERSKQRSG